MAPARCCCSSLLALLLLFLLITITTFSLARPQPAAAISSLDDVPRLPFPKFYSPAVIHSSPARPMPSYTQFGAPVPLPEFPTLPPPIVNSFPAAPLPSIAAPSPHEGPLLPGTTHAPPPSCHGYPPYLSSGPVVAPRPEVPPGPIAPSEGAPEPTAGGTSPPPY